VNSRVPAPLHMAVLPPIAVALKLQSTATTA
jgi:hypothetical protein